MTGRGTGELIVAPAVETDRQAIEKVLRRTPVFNADEVTVALEVLDVYLYQDGQEDYQVLTCSREGHFAGYVCYGFNALTVGLFELYWITVDPACQGVGIGTRLLDFVEGDARGQKGRKVAVETSSRPDYRDTLAFYHRRGYREEARVADFYAPGDDKIILIKDL